MKKLLNIFLSIISYRTLLPIIGVGYFFFSLVNPTPDQFAYLGILLIVEVILDILHYILNGRLDGFLQIDTSNPSKDIYRIQLNNAIDSLISKKQIVLKVDTKADLSQEKHIV